jgi:hypothetical protein
VEIILRSLETWSKETTRPSPKNLKRWNIWNIYSDEWKKSKNGQMEQWKAMEYESRKASSDVLKPRNIYKSGSDSSSNCRLENSWGSVLHRELIKFRRLLYLITFWEKEKWCLIDINRMCIYSKQDAGSSRKFNPYRRDSNRFRARFTDCVSCWGRSYTIAGTRRALVTGYLQLKQ